MKLPPRIAFSIDSPGRSGEKRSVPGATSRTMLWGAPGRSTITRRGRAGQAGGAARLGRGRRLSSRRAPPRAAARRLASSKSPATTRKAWSGAVVRGVKGAHVVEREPLDRALQPVGRQAVGMGVAEQQPIGDDGDDRLRLIAALRDGGAPIGRARAPSRRRSRRGRISTSRGDVQRREEGLARRLHRQLRAVAPAAEPEIGAELLELVGQREGVARAGPLVEHLGGRSTPARHARADRRPRRCGS